MSSQMNQRQLGDQLHQRLLAGSSLTVTSEIAELFLPRIIKSLAAEFKNIEIKDPHVIDTAAEDALLYYFNHPTKFDPARSGLFTYLRLVAKSSLLNSLDSDSERRKKVVEVGDVETVNIVAAQDEPDAEAALISFDLQAQIMQQVDKFINDPTDLRVVALMVAGIRETSKYAEAMGIIKIPITEQRKLVKQCKDRIKKVFERKIKPRRSQR